MNRCSKTSTRSPERNLDFLRGYAYPFTGSKTNDFDLQISSHPFATVTLLLIEREKAMLPCEQTGLLRVPTVSSRIEFFVCRLVGKKPPKI
jgi:hypothetical protein